MLRAHFGIKIQRLVLATKPKVRLWTPFVPFEFFAVSSFFSAVVRKTIFRCCRRCFVDLSVRFFACLFVCLHFSFFSVSLSCPELQPEWAKTVRSSGSIDATGTRNSLRPSRPSSKTTTATRKQFTNKLNIKESAWL